MRLLSSVRPTTSQKRVIAKIIASPTPTVAGGQLSADANLVAARNMLAKLGVISVADAEVTLTDVGQQLARDENIVDQMGELTQDGKQLAYTKTSDNPASAAGQMENATLLSRLLR